MCSSRSSIWLVANVATTKNLAVDDAYVYWTDAIDTVARVPISGGAIDPVWTGQAKPWGIAVDDAYVYWSNQLGGAIWRAAKTGGTPEVVATATSPGDIALYQDKMYWIDAAGSYVWAVAKTGGSGTVVATPTSGLGPGVTFRMMATSRGPFTRGYGSPTWYSYNVVDHVTVGVQPCIGCSNPDMAFDGTNFYFTQTSCRVAAADPVTGQATGCFVGSIDDYPLAASSCGIFYSNSQVSSRWLGLAHIGTTFGVHILDTTVDLAAISGGFLYFHSTSENSIGRIPLP
jgi:hypothetical protein